MPGKLRLSRLSKRLRLFLIAGAVLPVLLFVSSFSHLAMNMQGLFRLEGRREVTTSVEQVCLVQDAEISEASGMAVSRTVADSVWIHNDSGDSPRLFLVGLNGLTRAVVSLSGTSARDWEDMCSFEADGKKWLLIGDVGDNGETRGVSAAACRLLLIEEPAMPEPEHGREGMVRADRSVYAEIEISYPGGPANCESLAVDTELGEILLLTKSDPQTCALYRLPLRLTGGRSKMTAELVAKLPVPYATAMDVSPDGRRLVIVNMFSGAVLRRNPQQSWAEACHNPAQVFSLPSRPQGETVCYASDGITMFIHSEGRSQPVWRITVPQEP